MIDVHAFKYKKIEWREDNKLVCKKQHLSL